MLAYDLYLKNLKSNKELGFKTEKPIKKVFITHNRDKFDIKFDEKTIDDYGSPLPKFKALQQAWDMPINCSAGFPYKYKGGTEPKPYVILYGKVTGTEIILQASGKEKNLEKTFKAVKNRDTNIVSISAAVDVPFKSYPGPYKINGAELFGEYVRQGIVIPSNKISHVSATLLEAVAKAFFDKFPTRKIQDNKKYNFDLFLFPSDGEITYHTDMTQSDTHFVDAFGNDVTGFSDETSGTNAKFLSADDSAFILNLIDKKSEFYKQLGIGKESLEKISTGGAAVNIAGLYFYFFDISDPIREFSNVGKLGLFSQIYKNYEELIKDRHTTEALSPLKTLCIQRNQSKMEVLIDCNLTLDQLKRVLRVEQLGPELQDAPPLLFEELFIHKEGKTTIWKDYLWVVRSLLYDFPIEKSTLLKIFSKHLLNKRFKFIDPKCRDGGPKNALDYIQKADFCIKLFGGISMVTEDADEKFAHAIGQIAGKYVNFKRKAGEKTQSLTDILTYSKYDEGKLMFVLNKVGQGVFLSKEDEAKKQDMEKYIQNVQASIQSKMDNPNNDYSYFFYRGVFEELGRGE